MTNPDCIRESDRECMREFAAREPEFCRDVLLMWWFADADDYRRMRAAALDSEELPAALEEFHRVCSERREKALAAGHQTENVIISANALIAWCEATERPLDEVARQMFAVLTRAKSL